MKSRWKLVTCRCQHTTNLNWAWRGQSCKHHFGHLFNTTLKHSCVSIFLCSAGWDMSALAIGIDWAGLGYAELLYSQVDALHTGAWMNVPQGTAGRMGDGAVRGHPQVQATWMLKSGCYSRHQPPWASGPQLWESSLRSTSSGCKYLQPPCKAEPRSPMGFFSPSSVPVTPERAEILPQPPLCSAAICPLNHSSLFSLSKYPGKCQAACTSPNLGRHKGRPCLPMRLFWHKKKSFSLSPSKTEFLTCCLACWVKKRVEEN